MTSPPAPDPAITDRPVSRWAIATFVLGLVSLIPLSLLSGIVALIKTRDGKEPGRGLAVAGIVICVLWAAVWAYSWWPKTGLITGTLQSDRVGTCFRGDVNTPVSCDQPHSDELFAMLSLSRFPDSDPEQRQIENRCKAELPKYSATADRDPSIRVEAWSPGAEWKQLDTHAAGCVAHSNADRVRSIKVGPAFSWNSP
jgi:putative regulator of septum formation